MKNNLYYSYLAIVLFLGSCTTIRQGEVGVKRRLGKLDPVVRGSGVHTYNPFTTTIIKVPTRTINLPLALENIPSKEGLNITAEMAVHHW
jgi:prohibitin 1